MEKKSLKIGDLSKITGITVSGLRYYEQLGLIHASKNEAGYRLFDEHAPALCVFIQKAQGLGFSLDEIKLMIEEKVTHGNACSLVRSLAQNKVQSIKDEIEELSKVKEELEHFILSEENDLHSKDENTICPHIELAEAKGKRKTTI